MHILKYKYCLYQNQKKTLLQNILAVCGFDMKFWFILFGWEGLAYDNRIFKNTIKEKRFVILEKKYWLINAEYSNSNYLLML